MLSTVASTAVDRNGFDRVVERAEGNVADGLLVVFNGGLTWFVPLAISAISVVMSTFSPLTSCSMPHQLDERAARAGAFFTGITVIAPVMVSGSVLAGASDDSSARRWSAGAEEVSDADGSVDGVVVLLPQLARVKITRTATRAIPIIFFICVLLFQHR
jgi:hypothetical protein